MMAVSLFNLAQHLNVYLDESLLDDCHVVWGLNELISQTPSSLRATRRTNMLGEKMEDLK